jgi:hypothetical protein
MFLENLEQVPEIVARSGFSIFALPKMVELEAVQVPRAIVVVPNEKNTISIEEIRRLEELTRTKQVNSLVIMVQHADRLSEGAANALLKMLEAPGKNVHFGFLTYNPSKLLPTIRSRAQNYIFRDENGIDAPPRVDEKILGLAKQLVSATPRQLPGVVAEIAKDKVDARGKAVMVTDAAIQLLYKSYFKTGNKKFLDKLSQLLKAQAALEANGHIKLQLIANML